MDESDRFWAVKTLLSFLAVFLFSLSLALFIWIGANPLPDLEKINKLSPQVASHVYDNNGEEIDKFFYINRDPAKYGEIPDIVKQAFLSAEDKRFFEYKVYLLPWAIPYTGWTPSVSIPGGHWGFDPVAIFRALVFNLYYDRVVSGASTITQQLVRLVYEEEMPEFKIKPRTYKIKNKEIRIAFWMDYYYSKEKIFETLANLIYLGHGNFGIKEAARYYFGKELKELNPAEAAMIAALNKHPSRFCPIHEPVSAKERRDWILERMREDGYLTKKDSKSWVKSPISLNVQNLQQKRKDFGYASDYVRQTLLKNDFSNKKFNAQDIWYYGGLKIESTIDRKIQLIVNESLNKKLDELNGKIKKDRKLQGAVIVLENATGKIFAVSGGNNFLETKYNRAVNPSAVRQPGSAFKIFVYAQALKEGKGLNDIICDCPLILPGKIDFYGNVIQWWRPRNYEQKSLPPFMGQISLWKGIALSRNLATLHLAREIGMEDIITLAKEMGINSRLDKYLPTAIGASSVGLLELTSAYSIFANGGKLVEPHIIERIRRGDALIWEHSKKEKMVLPEEVAKNMAVLLRSVVLYGTAKSAKNLKQPIAGKTGTTDDFKDVWFMGFTPSYTIGVWIGYDIPEKIGNKLSGAVVALPVVIDIVNGIYKNRDIEYFSKEIEQNANNLITVK